MARAELPADIEALTFDCYGTLIDWDAGIRGAIGATPSLAGCDVERLVSDRDRSERELEAGDWLPYDAVLEASIRAAGRAQGRETSAEERRAFAASMARWPPHPDSPAALARLAARFRLAILSNVQTATLRASVQLLGAPFATLVTAEELRSYKPARAHFDEGLRRLGLPRERVLHVAQSLFHDVRPALRMGWWTAWVDRKSESLPADLRPHVVVGDLASLADRLGA